MPIVERKQPRRKTKVRRYPSSLTSLLGVCAQSQCRDGGEMLRWTHVSKKQLLKYDGALATGIPVSRTQ